MKAQATASKCLSRKLPWLSPLTYYIRNCIVHIQQLDSAQSVVFCALATKMAGAVMSAAVGTMP